MTNPIPILILSPLLALSAFGQTAPAGTPSPILDTKVVGFDEANGLLAMEGGSAKDVTLGDPFWLFSATGILADGLIYLTTERQCVGRLTNRPSGTIPPGQSVILIRKTRTTSLRDRWPRGVTMHGLLTEVSPGHANARLNIGRSYGLRPNDNLIIRRKGIPISRGRIVDLQENAATLSLQPLVRNALPEPGDVAELWPRPADRRLGRINSWVLDVQPVGEGRQGQQVIIVGTAADGLTLDRTVDIFRNGRYIACASINHVSAPLSTALIKDSMSAGTPMAGDEVIARPSLSTLDAPLSVAVFRVDEDGYCLLAGGEDDGLQVGDKFIIRHQEPSEPTIWQDIAELTITKLNQDFSGAYAYPLQANLPPVTLWDLADRLEPRQPQWRPIGILTESRVENSAGIADIDPRSSLQNGDIVRLAPSAHQDAEMGRVYAAALVVHRFPDRIVLYMPPGWGNPRTMKDARIDSLEKTMLYPLALPQRQAPATQPTTAPSR